MKPILTQLFAGLFLLLASQAFGQAPNVTTNFVVTEPAAPSPYPVGTKIVIELRVTNFTNIESMQFPITYNKDVMRFDSLSNSAFSNWSAGNFVSMPAAGKVGISWDGYSNGANMPFTFPNGTALFKLNFTAIGNGVSSVNITPSAAPPAVDIVGNGGTGGNVNYQGGGTPMITLGTGNPAAPPLVGFKIIANTIYIPQGERGCMPVTVNDFDNIVSMQWAMHWNNSVLNFECTRGYNLSGWSATDFNAVYSPGTLLAGWADPAGVGVTRVDGVRIVDVCFKAIGAPGSTTTVTIDGMNMPPTSGTAEAYNSATPAVNVWTAPNHPNGASGVSAPVNIIVTSPPATDVAYTVETVDAAPGSTACVSVKVKNFTSITSSEFALSYNTAELTYAPPQFGANPLNLQASNITNVPNLGVVKFIWANANGATVANDATIFSACFTVNANNPVGTISNLNFTSTPCPTVTGIGTAISTGGVSMARTNGWIKSIVSGPTSVVTSNVSCNGGNNGAITVTNPPSTTAQSYAWTGPGINPTNIGLQNQTALTAGTYTVTVTYTGGTTGTTSETITQPSALAQINTVNTVSCFGGSNGAINLTPAGGTVPYTYMWSNGSTVQDPSGLPVDIYTVIIKDANNCSLGPVSITVPGFIAISLQNPLVTNVTCAGLSTGSIEINPTGGAGTYTYDWSHNGPQAPDSDPKNLSGMPAGTYTVTVTDANGCTMSLPTSGQGITIGAPPPLVSNFISKTDVKCFGSATGTANIAVTGGTGTLTYCWSTGAGPCASQVEDPTNLTAGTYTPIVTDQNGCTATMASVVISNPPSPLSISGNTSQSSCFDQASGSINASADGGWGNYQYAWTGPISPIPPVPNPSPLPGGVYTVTVTDAGQCTSTQTFTVVGPPAIAQNPEMQPVTCFGVNNGGINLHLSGGNPPWNVVWSNTPLTGESIGVLAPGSYQPTVTDAQGCTKVFAAVVVTGPQALQIDTTITEANPNNGAIDLEITQGGTPGFSYLWSNGATTQDISSLSIGNYSVIVTDANACSRSFSFSVPSGNVLIDPLVQSIKNTCDKDGCINITLPQTAANFTPFILNWGFGTLQTSSLSPSICDLGAGVYNVTITASNGNSAVLSAIQITQLDPASINSNTQPPFDDSKNGKITLSPGAGVIGQLIYAWGPPLDTTGPIVSNLDSGLYVVTITNQSSGCVSVQTFQLDRQYAPLELTLESAGAAVSPNCANAPTGSISISVEGGNLPYAYQWVGPNGFTAVTQDIINLMPGVYSNTTTDENGTVVTSSWTLTAQSNLNITNVNETSLYPSGDQVSGFGICDGVAAVVFVPGLGISNIVWSNGVTGASNNTLCGGAYSVTVTDVANCSSVWSDVLTTPDAIKSTAQAVAVKCNGDCDGSAKISVEGGFAPYAVRWSTGQFDPAVFPSGFSQAVNLCGGDYTVTITDKNGVATTTLVNVPQPPQIVVDFATTIPRSFNACDGELLIDAAGAVEPITYVWSGSFGHTGNGERADNLCSGEFVEFFITDANGCTAYATDSVPYPEDGCFLLSPVITPGQQDGKNDYVVITCIEKALKSNIEIYNRWGQLVFETEGYTNNDADREHNWNGLTNSGTALAEGVYYYVLTFTYIDDQGNESEGVRKGAINLLQ